MDCLPEIDGNQNRKKESALLLKSMNGTVYDTYRY
jgi:hypothetical protein